MKNDTSSTVAIGAFLSYVNRFWCGTERKASETCRWIDQWRGLVWHVRLLWWVNNNTAVTWKRNGGTDGERAGRQRRGNGAYVCDREMSSWHSYCVTRRHPALHHNPGSRESSSNTSLSKRGHFSSKWVQLSMRGTDVWKQLEIWITRKWDSQSVSRSHDTLILSPIRSQMMMSYSAWELSSGVTKMIWFGECSFDYVPL